MVETTTDALVGTLGGVMALGVMANVAGKMMGGRGRNCECNHRKSERREERKERKQVKRRQSTVRDSFW